MDFFDAVKVVGRRWYVVLAMLGLTAVAAWHMLSITPPSYVASGSMLLLPPQGLVSDAARTSNPYLSYFPTLSTMAEVVSEVMSEPQVATALQAEGATNYKVGLSTAVQDSPLVTVTATDFSAAKATRSVQLVSASFEAHLVQQQARVGAAAKSFVRAETLTTPEVPTRQNGSRLRVVAAVGGLGLVFSFGLAFVVESIAAARAARRPSVPDNWTEPGLVPSSIPSSATSSLRGSGWA